MRFKQYYIEQSEYEEFIQFVESYTLNEGILSKISGALKKKIDFIKDVATNLKLEFSNLLTFFKNSRVFKFFQQIGWSFSKLYDILKLGFKSISIISDVVSKYIAETGIVKWTTKELKKLDEFLKSHPKTRKIVGLAAGAILIFIWFNMSFTGDPTYDFGMDDLLAALSGKMVLADIFGGANGIKLLMLFSTGLAGLSFPWPGPQKIQFVSAIIGTIANRLKMRIQGI